MGEQGRRAVAIAANPAPWQRCLHGNETLLRECVTGAILKHGTERAAFRYAACGLGDVVVRDGSGCHVAPKGCGHRLCPRCGRKKGRALIKRIFAWLAAGPHGDIFTMCLTQRVDPAESLPEARARMVAKEKRYLDSLKSDGMISGASCAHMVWSPGAGGWHYHVHLLLELPEGQWTCDDLRELYRTVAGCEEVQTDEQCSRLVCAAGPADPALVDGGCDPDFWSERSDGLAAAVQYPVRDIAQGITAKRLGFDRGRVGECVEVLLTKAKGWKLRRTFGQWRKPVPKAVLEEVAADEPAKKEPGPGSSPKPIVYGTVHRVSRFAAKGGVVERQLMAWLESSVRNNTDFGKRFVAFCRFSATGAVT